MSKLIIYLGIVLFLLSCLLYWVLDPYTLNPLSDTPISQSKSTSSLNCNELNGFSFKADSIINQSISKNDLLGLSTGIYSKDCGVWLSSAGFISKRNQEPTNQFSQFRIASVSKPMTAVAILQLYEKGIIDLDKPIQNYLPEFPVKEEGDITIRQLLNHTSGIPHYNSNFEIFNFTHYGNSSKALDKFKNRKLAFKPGTRFLYTSFGYAILGAIIETVTKRSYEDYMQQNIWTPLAMAHTGLEDRNLRYKNKSNLYIKYNGDFYRSPQNDLSYIYAGGGIQSTAEDLLKFGQAIMSCKLITAETTKFMMHLSDSTSQDKKYTYGWDNWNIPKYGRVIEHNGSQIGSSSFFRIYFDKKIVVVVLANSLNSSEEVRTLAVDISQLLLEVKD